LKIAQFKDATEYVWLVADHLFRLGHGGSPPQRQFVADADEAHQLALSGACAVVGMSLDDVVTCSLANHEKAPEITTFYGVLRGFLSLCAEAAVPDFKSLRGRVVAIDTYTGYASALFEILEKQGLECETDFRVALAGATDLRFAKLLQGDFSATLLGAPFDLLVQEQGFHSLATVLEALGGYQGVVFSAHRCWLDNNASTARHLTGVFANALIWASLPQNGPTLLQILGRGLPDSTSATTVARIADRLFGTRSEFCPDGALCRSDLRGVLRLYAKYRKVDLRTYDLAKVIDQRFLSLI